MSNNKQSFELFYEREKKRHTELLNFITGLSTGRFFIN